MIPLLASLAFAGQIEAVTPNGALRPGVPGSVLVAGVDDRGRSLGMRPRATAGSGAVRVVREVSPGIWELSVTPPMRPGLVPVEVAFGETREAFTFPVKAYPKSIMTVPERVDAYAGTRLLPVELVGQGSQ